MTKPVFLITLGALAGAVAGMANGGGAIGHVLAGAIIDKTMSIVRMAQPADATPAPRMPVAAADASHFRFSACLHKSGDNVEGTLRNLLEFHEHNSTVALVGCLLDGEPLRFCAPAGRQQAADAMEIYFWSRDDARRTSPAHGLADKIHWLDRVAQTGDPAANADPFVLTWTGPGDRAIFDKLRDLAKQGYLDPGAFAFSGRAELREALRDVKSEASPCAGVAGR